MSTRQKRLAKARKERQRTSQALKALKNGDLTLIGVLQDPPGSLLRVRIHTVMVTAPHMGEAGVKKVLTAAKVWPEDRLGNISDEDKQRIIDCLPARAK